MGRPRLAARMFHYSPKMRRSYPRRRTRVHSFVDVNSCSECLSRWPSNKTTERSVIHKYPHAHTHALPHPHSHTLSLTHALHTHTQTYTLTHTLSHTHSHTHKNTITSKNRRMRKFIKLVRCWTKFIWEAERACSLFSKAFKLYLWPKGFLNSSNWRTKKFCVEFFTSASYSTQCTDKTWGTKKI